MVRLKQLNHRTRNSFNKDTQLRIQPNSPDDITFEGLSSLETCEATDVRALVQVLRSHLRKDESLVLPLISALSLALVGDYDGTRLQLSIESTARKFIDEYENLHKEHEKMRQLISEAMKYSQREDATRNRKRALLLTSLEKYISNQDRVMYPAALAVSKIIVSGDVFCLLDL